MKDIDFGSSGSLVTPKRIIGAVLGIVVLIFAIIGPFNLAEQVSAGEICVIQSPFTGELSWYTTPGVKWQGFGKVTKYPKRSQYSFSKDNDVGKTVDQSLKVRFNDGAHANLSGSIAWEMPLDVEHLNDIHSSYGAHEAIEQALIRPVVEKAIYMTGPLMSSKESYAEKRPMLLRFMEDQIQNGVYSTTTTQVRQVDPLTNQERTVVVVEIQIDPKTNLPLRTEESPLKRFGVTAFNPAINEVAYTADVEAQIQQQQKAVMDVQTAVAQAKKAEQDAITAKENGKADAAKAEAEQNVQLAAQKVKVTTAESYRQEQILRADGDAYARQKNLAADGGLDAKLQAYKDINQMWADAFKNHQGNVFPSIIMGAGTNPGSNGAQSFMDMITATTARNLALDLSIPGKTSAPK